MEDGKLDKAIKGLEHCTINHGECNGCPYSIATNDKTKLLVHDCNEELTMDILNLLKEYQEKIETARKWLKEDSVDLDFIAKQFVL